MTELSVETCSPIISGNKCCADVNNWLSVIISFSCVDYFFISCNPASVLLVCESVVLRCNGVLFKIYKMFF